MCLDFSDDQRRALQRRVSVLQGQAHAFNTRATYRVGVLAFLRFCLYFGLIYSPPSDDTLAAFVAHQSRTCSFKTLKVYLAGVRTFVLSRGFPFTPWGERYPVFRAMQGCKREFGDSTTRKLAVTPVLLL